MTFWQGRFFVSLLVAASLFMASLPTKGSAQSTVEKLFGINEVRSQELTPYWSEGLHTLLEIFCTSLRCEAERSDDDTHYFFSLADVELPASELGGESALVVQVESIRASISKDGLRDFNGFPENLDISISGVTLNDDGILEIAAALFSNDTRLQRLISRELAKESLSLKLSLRRGEIDYKLDFSIKLLSGDQISGSITLLATKPIFTFLIKDMVSADELSDIEDRSVRGALLYDSIEWSSITYSPLIGVSVGLTEVSLLDKIYGPFLIDKKSDGEREFWQKVRAAMTPLIDEALSSPRFLGKREDFFGIIDFFANWRSKQGEIQISVAESKVDDLVGQIEEFFAEFEPRVFKHSDIQKWKCGFEAVFIPVIFAGFAGSLPYIPQIEEALNEGNFLKGSGQSAGSELLEVMDVLDCPNGILEISYQAGE